MPDAPLLLVVDPRWPLDADAGRAARELETAAGTPITTLRVPTGGQVYDLPPPGDGVVVVVGEHHAAVAVPPKTWSRPVCWYVEGSCTRAWLGGREVTTTSLSEFVTSSHRPESSSPWPWAALVTGGGCSVLAVVLLAGVIVRLRRTRRARAG